ncbi:MAG TPA: ECF transporter S component [Ardenticatenaceae bacterium]
MMLENRTQFYVLIALMIALVAVVTATFVVPVGAGIFNFSDTAVYLAAFLLGPLPGFLAGGIGTALADTSLGFASFAPLSFLAHGTQGLLAGWLARDGTTRGKILGVVAGTIAMAGIYFLGEYFGPGGMWGGPAQAQVEWPFNILQNIGGAIIAIPLSEVLRRAYPPLTRYTK